jgi:hypothetical protein
MPKAPVDDQATRKRLAFLHGDNMRLDFSTAKLKEFAMMNIVQISEHIGECLTTLTADTYPSLRCVVLIHGGDNDISMVSNFAEQQDIFEVLTRSMVSCFGPKPSGAFQIACLKIGEVIRPAILASAANSVVCCFWDDKLKESGILSTLDDRSVVFAIICEHMVRVISGVDCYHEGETKRYTLH